MSPTFCWWPPVLQREWWCNTIDRLPFFEWLLQTLKASCCAMSLSRWLTVESFECSGPSIVWLIVHNNAPGVRLLDCCRALSEPLARSRESLIAAVCPALCRREERMQEEAVAAGSCLSPHYQLLLLRIASLMSNWQVIWPMSKMALIVVDIWWTTDIMNIRHPWTPLGLCIPSAW